MLSSIIISHSKLSCNDESATLDEQSEKILYYYPESTTISEQLTQIGCLESLVQFSNTFSDNNIDYVLLKNSTWGFLECEENLWIYVNIRHPNNSSEGVDPFSKSSSSSSSSSSNTTTSTSNEAYSHALHIPNGGLLADIITKLYRMYTVFHGSINEVLFPNPLSWTEILKARELRKRARKLQSQMDQLDDDLRYLRRLEDRRNRPPSVVEPSDEIDDDDMRPVRIHSKASDKNETLSFFEGKKSSDLEAELTAVSEAVASCQSELVSLLHSDTYSPDSVRQSLLTFMRWYLSRGELVSATFLHQCHGMNNTAAAREVLPYIVRIRNELNSINDMVQGMYYILFSNKLIEYIMTNLFIYIFYLRRFCYDS